MPSKMFLSLAVAGMAIALYAVPALTAEKATDIPTDTYYKDPLTASERSGIASEENVSPNDDRQSLPTPQDEGVIPDAGDKADRDAAIETPAQNLKEDTDRSAEKRGESEANAILDESKKDFKVTKKGLADCLKDWDPQTQMSKSEWAESCRTTLEYFPDGQ
ncbi:hypothetical protein GIW81_11220 [Hyphomicrobium sp. xq]|uniref:Uncharacterized protein n=1 Tax=Hyphomicrobium album TaxID=2665159 RepID=A0A6I3KQC7_9HYPH|nr:hypothetical protein [Hyphomicrobium album]MTD94901.1 hypothetical protein [Hyphomicrobium album]